MTEHRKDLVKDLKDFEDFDKDLRHLVQELSEVSGEIRLNNNLLSKLLKLISSKDKLMITLGTPILQ